MAKLDIGVGEAFPLEEKSGGEDCRRGRHGRRHDHHHHFWHDWFRRRTGRRPDDTNTKDKE